MKPSSQHAELQPCAQLSSWVSHEHRASPQSLQVLCQDEPRVAFWPSLSSRERPSLAGGITRLIPRAPEDKYPHFRQWQADEDDIGMSLSCHSSGISLNLFASAVCHCESFERKSWPCWNEHSCHCSGRLLWECLLCCYGLICGWGILTVEDTLKVSRVFPSWRVAEVCDSLISVSFPG